MTHYETLGVARTATADEIRAAYKRAAAKWHPDRAPKGQEERYKQRFQELGAAYYVLGVPSRRAEYDGKTSAPGLMTQAQVDAVSRTATAGGPCPVCHGAGELRTPDLSKDGRILFWSNKPCPRGCKGKKC